MVKRMNESFEQGLDMFDKACKKVYGADWDKKSDKEKHAIIMSFIAAAAKKGLDKKNKDGKKESKVRRTSGRRMTEDYDDEFEGGINGYAVQIHDYTKGYINLLCYNDIEDAEYAEERLDALWQESEDGNISDEEYFYELSDILTFADSYIEEIDFRRNIDSDNCYSDRRYGRWQIINEVPCPVYL